MEYSNYYVRSSSIKSSSHHSHKRFLRSANLIREYKDFQFYDHVKRNLKGTNVNSDASANSDNANNLITYEHLGESWLELVLPITILGITVLGVVLIGVILVIWIRKYFSEAREKCPTGSGSQHRKCTEKLARKMNSRKWLRSEKHRTVDSQQVVVGDLEQKLETVEYKNSPPTSPKNEESETEILNEPEEDDDDDDDDDDEEEIDASLKTSPMILPCPLAISDFSVASLSHPQPSCSSDSPVQQQVTSSTSSSLSLLQEELHCIQPREEQSSKVFKSIATSPPPFSPIVHQHSSHKYATTGTQTYFTKAPNSPNNHLLASSFAVLQTPTTSTVPSGNPFAASENKENKEPKLRNTCLNKAISTFKQDNGGTSSSPSSPPSVISTSPTLKVNQNVLQQQNSPVIGDSSPPISRQFNFSPKILTGTNSPTISSANYKFGNYFRFPDVGTPPVPPAAVKVDDRSSSSSSLNKQSSTNTSDESTDVAIKSFQNLSMESDRDSIILKIDEVESPVKSPTTINNNNSLTIRRARLKSISLDSDGARLVEENLTMPVEELVEIASYNNQQISDSEPDDCATSSSANNNNNSYNPKNIYNLTINLDFRDSSLDLNDINMNPESEETDDAICRTPTMRYFRNKKAVSLDSDSQEAGKVGGKTASSETFNYYFGQPHSKMSSSTSVPSTPKHMAAGNKLKISMGEERPCYSRHGRKLGSFEENVTTQSYKTNLTASIQQLNVSSSNLKTLPEIMSITDFDGNQSPKPPRAGPPLGIPPSKSGILQRRGSNQSLTLNLDGSCGNLARGLSCSNYSLGNIHGSHLNIAGPSGHRISAVKKNLLHRRSSNTSLTLNVQESNNNLNRFNSHSSLNIVGSKAQPGGKNLLERRNSNASLTLNIQNRGLSISNCNLRGSECSLSSVNTNQMELMMMEQEAEQEAEAAAAKDQENNSRQCKRKFLSSENLHNLSINSRGASASRPQSHQTPYGSIDNLKQTQPYHEKIPVISTKPLSPQSTSEDFKIYLANIQFLQSASNVLDEEHLLTLNSLFQKSYKSQPKPSVGAQQQFNNDDILNNRMGNDGPPIAFANSSPDEDQKELLIKLHQEFWNLPTNYQEKPMVFGSQPKNRYKTILPNEHSRVILQREEGCQVEPYVNANFIKGPDYTSDAYIATQGPMQNTVYEFWLMIQQNMQKMNGQGIQKIAMLTDFIESARQKCAVYFPSELDDVVIFTNTNFAHDENVVRESLEKIFDPGKDPPIIAFNYFVVKNVGLKQKNGYSIRKLRLFYGADGTIHRYDVFHYWFPDWPDHRSPQDIDVLLDMSIDLLDGNCLKDFDEAVGNDETKNPLPVLHCSAGIGRTGCLAAILNGLGQLRSTGEVSVDVLGIVCNLRLQRGGMVQNSEQYELIHRSLCLYQQKISQK